LVGPPLSQRELDQENASEAGGVDKCCCPDRAAQTLVELRAGPCLHRADRACRKRDDVEQDIHGPIVTYEVARPRFLQGDRTYVPILHVLTALGSAAILYIWEI
jgi:hypothetical protein